MSLPLDCLTQADGLTTDNYDQIDDKYVDASTGSKIHVKSVIR